MCFKIFSLLFQGIQLRPFWTHYCNLTLYLRWYFLCSHKKLNISSYLRHNPNRINKRKWCSATAKTLLPHKGSSFFQKGNFLFVRLLGYFRLLWEFRYIIIFPILWYYVMIQFSICDVELSISIYSYIYQMQ